MDIKRGDQITVFHIDSMLAMTHRTEYLVVGVENANGQAYLRAQPRSKRTVYNQPIKDQLVFRGWDIGLLADTDLKGVMRGNACFNLMGEAEVIRGKIRTEQINPQARLDNILAIGEDGSETVVFPGMGSTHSVIQRLREKENQP